MRARGVDAGATEEDEVVCLALGIAVLGSLADGGGAVAVPDERVARVIRLVSGAKAILELLQVSGGILGVTISRCRREALRRIVPQPRDRRVLLVPRAAPLSLGQN